MDRHPLVNLLVPIRASITKQREALEMLRRNERMEKDDLQEVERLLADLLRDVEGQIQRLRQA